MSFSCLVASSVSTEGLLKEQSHKFYKKSKRAWQLYNGRAFCSRKTFNIQTWNPEWLRDSPSRLWSLVWFRKFRESERASTPAEWRPPTAWQHHCFRKKNPHLSIIFELNYCNITHAFFHKHASHLATRFVHTHTHIGETLEPLTWIEIRTSQSKALPSAKLENFC